MTFGYDDEWVKVPRLIIEDELSRLMRRVIDNHVNAGQMASGKTAKSMRVEADEDGGRLVGRAFFGVLETGRKAGKVPHGFIHIIRQWMRDKGIEAEPIPYVRPGAHKYTPQERGNMSMAACIAQTIKKKGTRLYRDGGRHDIYSKEVEQTTKNLLERIDKFAKSKIETIPINLDMEIK